MDILQCTILVQDIHKNTPGKKVKGCLPFTSDSLYSLCFEQEYVLVQPTYKPNSDTSPSPTTCTRKIIRQDITDVDNFQHINLDSHEVAGYLICLPKVTKEEVLVLSQKTDRIVVVEGEEVVEFDHRDRMLVVFFLEEAEKYKDASHPNERITALLDVGNTSKLLFLEVMWHLHRLETLIIATEDRKNLGQPVVEKMRKVIGTSHQNAHFLFLAIIFRMFRKNFREACGDTLIIELAKKITAAIEDLPLDVVVQAVESFITLQSKESKVYFNWRKRNLTTFELIQTACESSLTYRTQRLHTGECSTYQVMFWGLLAQKFYSVHPTKSAQWIPGPKFWDTHYVRKMKDRVLDSEAVEHISKGKELGHKLGLPGNNLLSRDHLLQLIQRPNCLLTVDAVRNVISLNDDQEFIQLTCQVARRLEGQLMSVAQECSMDDVDQVIGLLQVLHSKGSTTESLWWVEFLHRFSLKNKLPKKEVIRKVSSVSKENVSSVSNDILFFAIQRLFDGIDMDNCLYGLFEVFCCLKHDHGPSEEAAVVGGASMVAFTMFKSSDAFCLNENYQFLESFEQCNSMSEMRGILFVQLTLQESLPEIMLTKPTPFQVAGFFVCTVEERRKEVIEYSLKNKLNVIVLICDEDALEKQVEKHTSYFRSSEEVVVLLKMHKDSNFSSSTEIVPNHPTDRLVLLLSEHQQDTFTFYNCMEAMWHMGRLDKMRKPHMDSLLNYFFNNVKEECFIREFFIRLMVLNWISSKFDSSQDNDTRRRLNAQSMSIAFLLVKTSPLEAAKCIKSFLPRNSSEVSCNSYWTFFTLKSMFTACMDVLEEKSKLLKTHGTDGHIYSVLSWGMIVLKLQSYLSLFGSYLIETGPKFWEKHLLQNLNSDKELNGEIVRYLAITHYLGLELELDECDLIGAECLISLLGRSQYNLQLTCQIISELKLLSQGHMKVIISVTCDSHMKFAKNNTNEYLRVGDETVSKQVFELLSSIRERSQDQVSEYSEELKQWFDFVIFIASYEQPKYSLLKKIVDFSSAFPQSVSDFTHEQVLCAIRQKINLIPCDTWFEMCADAHFPLADDVEAIEEYFQSTTLPLLSDDRWVKFLKEIVSRHPGERHIKLTTTIISKVKKSYRKRSSRLNFETLLNDLFKLDVPGLLHDVSNTDELRLIFEIICCGISVNALTETCVNLSPDADVGSLQELLLVAIYEALKKSEISMKDFLNLKSLKDSIKYIQKCVGMESAQLKEHGCWVLVHYVSERIPVRMRSFEQLVPSLSVIKRLGKLSVVLSSQDRRTEHDQFNNFVQNMRSFVDDWLRCLSTRSFTYHHIMLLTHFEKEFKEILAAFNYQLPSENLHDLKDTFRKMFQVLKDRVAIQGNDQEMYDLEELLSKYGVQLPTTYSQIQMPKFQHVKEKKFYKSSSLTFCNLQVLTNKVDKFLTPMLDHWHLWSLYATSTLFRSYFGCFYSLLIVNNKFSEIVALGKALQSTSELLTRMLKSDNITLKDVTVEGSLKLDNIINSLQFEVNMITESLGIEDRSIPQERVDGLVAMIKLVQMTDFVNVVCDVCNGFELTNCISSPDFKRLNEIALIMKNESEKKFNMDPSTALQNKNFAVRMLSPCTPKFFCLFEQLSKSREFYFLIREKFYKGVVASDMERNVSVARSFRQTLEVITQQLQHEEYEEQVLNHLYPAFQFVLPFMDRDQSFKNLMENVSKLESPSNFSELKNVRKNMNQIKQWFQQTEGEFTFSNVHDELEQLLDTGEYYFYLTSRVQASLFLKLYPKSQTEAQSDVVLWNEEQICAFEQKLSLMDDREGMQERISTLLTWNEVARRFLSALLNLYKLGYTELERFKSPLKITSDLSVAETKVLSCEKEVETWAESIHGVYQEYQLLLFFSIVKLFKLHALLDLSEHETESVKKIAHEVLFLFRNDRDVWNELTGDGIKLALSKINQATNPVQTVGSFLENLCYHIPQLSGFVFPRRFKCSHEAGVKLCVAHNFKQEKLIRLLISLASGVPESFDILHCSVNTTMDDLKLFLNRARMLKLRRTFFVLEVNALSYHLQEHLLSEQYNQLESQLVFIETSPSLLREVSGVIIQDCLERSLLPSSEVSTLCKEIRASSPNAAQVILVYGASGAGKTYHIKKELKKLKESVVITLNETFTVANAIAKLNKLNSENEQCGIFFNYTMSPPGDAVSEEEKCGYQSLVEKIGWFFFHLVLLGHVEDEESGASFHSPVGNRWKIFVEVPSHENAKSSLDYFCESIAPSLSFVGDYFQVESDVPYEMDDDVKLVSKYLLAFESGRINSLYMDSDYGSSDSVRETVYDCTQSRVNFSRLQPELVPKIHQLIESGKLKKLVLRDKPVKFSEDEDPGDNICWNILYENMPVHVKSSKIAQTFFIRYMARRCRFLEKFPGFLYNNGLNYRSHRGMSGGASVLYTSTILLGETVVRTMLDEASEVCKKITTNWSSQTHQQLIYDIKDGGGALNLIALKPDEIDSQTKHNYKDLGIDILQESTLHERTTLENYLCCALYEDAHSDTIRGCHQTLLDEKYVLTLDFLLKMLKIHERRLCGVPVLIEGETGVGKTALVEMLSLLWNHEWKQQWLDKRRDLGTQLATLFEELGSPGSEAVTALTAGNLDETCFEAMLKALMSMSATETESQARILKTKIESLLLELHLDPILPLLQVQNCSLKIESNCDHTKKMIDMYSKVLNNKLDVKELAELLYLLLQSESASLFHKLNIHAALRYEKINDFLEEVFLQAKQLRIAFPTGVVTLYLDEVNTSTFSGVFKEIIIDRSLDGVPFPENIFIIAACNPHRSNSLASRQNSSDDIATKNSYYVRELHPTMELMKWDFGALDDKQERLYVFAKLQLMQSTFSDGKIGDLDVSSLAELVVDNHAFMRECAQSRLENAGYSPEEAHIRSKSCVSQRDIQRLFIFYEYLMKFYTDTDRLQPHGCKRDVSTTKVHRRAILVSLGLVYYMRLSVKDRQRYVQKMEESSTFDSSLRFSVVLKEELDWHANNVELPVGIAKTEALKENIMSIIICCVTGVPLIIEGAPGTSKTVSFNIAVGNVKGKESLKPIFKDAQLFPCLDPYFYQCSRRTTSEEVEIVFKRAINRQQGHNKRQKDELSYKCVVFMDEAGLPEKAHESLKVLHYYLEHPIVSFVAITNHPLDAAKSNRAVCIYRPEIFKNDVEILATDCLGLSGNESESTCQTIRRLCDAYTKIMKMTDFSSFYGLRDFVYFLVFLRRKCQKEHYPPTKIINGLQRNFGGLSFDDFLKLSSVFLNQDAVDSKHLKTSVELLKDSFHEICLSDETEFQTSVQSDVRYKLLIDPSEDDSLTRILFTFDLISDRKSKVRKYVCSDLAGSSYSEVHTIAKVRHSATEGHTIVMFQTDSIHECFYDLFNQRFRCITVQGQLRFYANITKGTFSKLSRVSPEFQCVIVIKKSELPATPNAFLNRFEKYYLTYSELLEIALSYLQPCFRIVIQSAFNKAKEFVNTVEGNKSLYGYDKENNTTLMSLLLTLLPSESPKNWSHVMENITLDIEEGSNTLVLFLECILVVLKKLGFYFFQSPSEIKSDAMAIQSILVEDEQFKRLLSSRTHEEIFPPIREAFEMLYTASDPSDPNYNEHKREMLPDACLIISFLQQWIIRYLCKRLMQIMTPEGLAVHYRKLPKTYRQVYLDQQEHFSLKKLIARYLSMIGNNGCATKLMCFTRLSQMISQGFPSLYLGEMKSNCQHSEQVKVLFHDDPRRTVICKVTTSLSQSYIEKLIKDFLTSSVSQVMIFTAAFHGAQPRMKKIINHIRIMIEEEEKGSHQPKLFVVLIHFLPIMLSSSCYPSLYLHGWDHYYLDSICETHGIGLRDLDTPTIVIKDWFLRFCLKETVCTGADNLFEFLEKILCLSYPIIVSRAKFGQDHTVCFNKPMDAFERIERVSFLLENFENGAVGKVLLKMFQRYWTPRNMNRYVRNAAIKTYSFESRLSLSESIQHMLQLLFFEFLSYMVSWMNVDYTIDLVLAEDNSNLPVKEFFLNILSFLPLPDISSLEDHKLMSSFQKQCWNKLKFPFFDYVKTQLELVTNRCRQEIHVLEDNEQSLITQNLENKVVDLACTEFSEILEAQDHSCILQVFAAIAQCDGQSNSLWHCYMNDFICQCIVGNSDDSEDLGLRSDGDSDKKVCISFLEDYFSPLSDVGDIQKRMFKLHVHTAYNLLNLKKLIRTLLQVDESLKLSSVEQTNVAAIQISRTFSYRYGELVNSIINNLFCMLQAIPGCNLSQMMSWADCYFSMVSIPTIRENLFRCGDDKEIAFRFTVMQAVFLTFQCIMNNPCTEEQSQVLFSFLQTALKIEVESDTPISTLVKSGYEAIGNTIHFKLFVEGMFDHLVYMERSLIKDKDVVWLLKVVNNSSELESLEKVISASLAWPHKRYFLHKILGYCPESIDMEDSIFAGEGLPLFSSKERSMVGKLLLLSDKQHNELYIPRGYLAQEFSILSTIPNNVVHQDLCHLYFEVVLQRLRHKKLTHSICIRAAEKITNSISSNQGMERNFLMLIEKQALIQHTIQLLACDAHKQVQHMISLRLVKKLNLLLEESMVEGHAVSFAYNLLVNDKVRSTTKLVSMVSDEEGIKKELTCLHHLDDHLPGNDTSRAGTFPFVVGGYNTEQSRLYQKVALAMKDIHASASSNNDRAVFKDLCEEWCVTDPERTCDGIPGKLAFLASVWLSTYHNFFSVKKTSIVLARYMIEILHEVGFNSNQIRIIACFLDPENFMVRRDEPVMPSDFNPDYMNIDHFDEPGGRIDPLFDFFSSLSSDVTDRMLQQTVANLIAVVLSLPPRSNHLWYHLIEPSQLHGTYIMGYMYDKKMCSPYFYDCGVEMTVDGKPGKYGYEGRISKTRIKLESEHLLLLANFSMLCISLLTQEDVELSNTILTASLPPRQYCVLKMKAAWFHMQTLMRLTVEKASFFVMQCCQELIKIGTTSSEQLQGLIHEGNIWDHCECVWHEKVYAVVRSNLDHQSFENYCQDELNSHLLCLVRALEVEYPFFPSELDLLGYFGSDEHLEEKYPVLYRFCKDYQKLQVGSEILSDLVEFYQWLHRDMNETLSYEDALSTTVTCKVNEFAGKYADTVHLPEIYKRVQAGYNKYATAISGAIGLGACALENRKNKLYNLSDETKIYPLLSVEDEGWLYVVIENIVKIHNRMLRKLHDYASKLEGVRSPILQLREINLLEVNKAMCLIDSSDRFHQMIFRRGCMKTDESQGQVQLSFDLPALQSDIIHNFLSGKPLIQDPIQNKIDYHFKERRMSDFTTNALAHISSLSSLPPELKDPIDEGSSLIRELGLKFHSASFDQVMDVFSGMKNIGMHLIKQLEDPTIQSEILNGDLSIKSFLTKYVFRNSHRLDVFQHIGMVKLHPTQTDCLGNIPIKYLFGTVNVLTKWISDGYYNYHMLPLAVKKPLDASSQEAVLNLSENYTGSLVKEKELDADLTELLEAFSIFEGHLKDHYGHMDLQASILELLVELDVIGEENSLLQNIPATICVEHYVHFRIALSQMQKGRERLTLKEHHFSVRKEDKWMPPDVFNLWEHHFTHVSRTIRRVNAPQVDTDEQDSDEEDSQPEAVSSESAPAAENWTTKAESLTTEQVVKFLISIKLESCVKAVEAAEVDGCLMAAAVRSEKDDMLKDIGITRAHHMFKVRSNFSKFVQNV